MASSQEARPVAMSQTRSPTYRYQSLQSIDSIRLIRLYPGLKGSPLQCNLFEVRRCVAPRYEALSYAWGETSFMHTIEEVASSSHLNITLNLYTALQGIRFKQVSRLLWVDAICINQQELKEKSHQVASMGYIFDDAWRVVVWLGSHRGTAKRIIFLLEELRTYTRVLEGKDSLESNKHGRQDRPVTNMIWLLSRLQNLQFFQQPWQSRVWVVQEFVLAREVQIMAADDEIPFDLLMSAIYEFSAMSRDATIHVWHSTTAEYPCLDILAAIRRMSQLCSYRDRRQSLERMKEPHERIVPRYEQMATSLASCFSELTLDRDCKEERDRIYAILAVSDKDLGIVADYELPLYDVYNDFATRALLAEDLSLLHLSGMRPGHQHELKSYAPYLGNRESMTSPYNAPHFMFYASTYLPVSVHITSQNSLSLRGVIADQILRIGHDLQPQPIWLGIGDFDKVYDELLGSTIAPRVSPHTPDHLLPQSDITPRLKNAHYWDAAGCIDFTRGSGMDAETYLRNRCMFQTHKGYIGLGPFWMKPGDQVVMFDGGVTPFIIRRNLSDHEDMRDTWLHVGDCYLHGWMRGNYFGHTVVDELPPKEESTGKVPVDEEKKYLVREWFTLA